MTKRKKAASAKVDPLSFDAGEVLLMACFGQTYIAKNDEGEFVEQEFNSGDMLVMRVDDLGTLADDGYVGVEGVHDDDLEPEGE